MEYFQFCRQFTWHYPEHHEGDAAVNKKHVSEEAELHIEHTSQHIDQVVNNELESNGKGTPPEFFRTMLIRALEDRGQVLQRANKYGRDFHRVHRNIIKSQIQESLAHGRRNFLAANAGFFLFVCMLFVCACNAALNTVILKEGLNSALRRRG